jgi:hypothetical protein
MKAIIARIAEQNNGLTVELIESQIVKFYTPSIPWGSHSAKELAGDTSLDKIKATGKDGKILLDDVKRALGHAVKKKPPTLAPFVSRKAKDEARNCGFKITNLMKDFKMSDRTGVDKNGKPTKITLADVRKKFGKGKEGKVIRFASKKAEELADKYKYKPSDIKGTGDKNKIKLSDVKKKNDDEKNAKSEDSEDSVDSDAEVVDSDEEVEEVEK